MLPKSVSRHDAYLHDSEVKQAKSVGVGVIDEDAESKFMEEKRNLIPECPF